MNLLAKLIARPIGLSLIAIGLFVIGVLCYRKLGVASLPQFNTPVIFVRAEESGASATTMAATVTAPLERHLGQIAGIDQMRSNTSDGSSLVFLIFQTNHNIRSAAQDVQAAINAAENDLPADVSKPNYEKANPNDDPIIALALTGESQSAPTLYALADNVLGQRIRQLPGISSVEIAGAASPAIRIDVNLNALAALGLTTDDVRNTVRAANVVSPTGYIVDGKAATALLINDTLRTPEDFAQLVIARRAANRVVRLGDVAHVYQGQEDDQQAAWFNKKSAVILYVYLQSGANSVETVQRLKNILPELKTSLPHDTKLVPFFDQTPTVRASLFEVQMTLCISMVIVVIVMGLFLRRVGPTLIVAMTLPLSLAGASCVMYLCGFTLNTMSLLALIIAIGLVVDDAVVVVENIMRYIDAGMDKKTASIHGLREIRSTILSITLSLIAVFIPILCANGMLGAFFREFIITLISAILVSMLVSFSLTPALCAVFLRPHTTLHHTTPTLFDRLQEYILRAHRYMLRLSLRFVWIFASLPIVLIFVSLYLVQFLDMGAFPAQDTGLIVAHANSSATIAFPDMVKRQERITSMLLADPAVATVSARIGSGFMGSTVAFSISLKSRAAGRTDTTQQVAFRLAEKTDLYPDLDVRMRVVEDLPSGSGPGFNQGAQYRLEFEGNNFSQLQDWVNTFKMRLQKVPNLRDVDTDSDSSGMLQTIVIDRKKAARLGVEIGQTDSILYSAFGQRAISTIYNNTTSNQVILSAQSAQSATPQSLDWLYIPNSNHQMIPLGAFSTQVPGIVPPRIEHNQQMTEMSLSYNIVPGVSVGEALKDIQNVIKQTPMPDGIRQVQNKDFFTSPSQSSMLMLLLETLAVVYIVLGMLYESLVHPITILSTLPAAGVGALLALVVTHTELSVISMIAFVLLVGIIKKNAILLIDFALSAERQHRLAPAEAVYHASLIRFRPIMMTTAVSILAAIPLAIGFGQGSELRRPLGIALIGGLVISQLLALYSTPALYVVFSRIAQWITRIFRALFSRKIVRT